MPLRFPRLSSLRIFEAAGRHLNFKHAAIELRVTPNAMSHVIMGWRRCPGSNPGLERDRRLGRDRADVAFPDR
jgi:hypothetical protein